MGTPHFCPVAGRRKSFGKPYTRKDKLQEHMRKKHSKTEAGTQQRQAPRNGQ
jgi:hypothetical protein